METWIPILFCSVLLVIALLSDKVGYSASQWEIEE